MAIILIIDDEADIRTNLVELLELGGYDTLTACNGLQGLELISIHNPDIVLCDVNMPELDGYELLGVLSQKMKVEEMPIFLFLSAKVDSNDITHGLRLGADDYILKPFDHLELLKAIKMRLEKRESRNHSKEIGFRKLAIPSNNGLELIDFDRITMCKAQRAYCIVYTSDGKNNLVSKPMKYFEHILVENGFIKVHKSTIVNPLFIRKYVRGSGGYLVLEPDVTVDVSSNYKVSLEALLRGNSKI